MLACARIGAAHSVVFGGFSSQALADRINDAEAKVLITADGGCRRGEVFPLKPPSTRRCATTPTIEHVVVVKRGGNDVDMDDGRDHWWHDLMAGASADCPAEPMDAEHLLFILYTSRHHRQAQGHHAHHRAATSPTSPTPTSTCSTSTRTTTSSGAPPTSAGSPATATSCTARSPNGATLVMYEGVPEPSRQRPLLGDHREVRRHDPLHGADGDPHVHEVGRRASRPSTTCRRCACSARSASRSTPRPGCGTTSTSAAAAARSSTPGGRPRPAAS